VVRGALTGRNFGRKIFAMTATSQKTSQKLSISISAGLLRFVEQYQQRHQFASRSEVFTHALYALRELEFAESYREAALEARINPDPLESIDALDGFEPSDGSEWLR
jgi:Arc/MetJ-type ribon-helix-helix transcriptional regulator